MIYLICYLAVTAFLADVVVNLSFKPLLREAQDRGIDNEFTRSPATSLATQFLLCWLFAPAFAVILFMPRAWEAYERATAKIVLEQREI